MLKKTVCAILIIILCTFICSCGKSGKDERIISSVGQAQTDNERVKTDSEKLNDTDKDDKISSENTKEQKGQLEQQQEEFIKQMKKAEGLRPYAVMIGNEGSRCLPQGGIDQAQIIYEIIVEGGITRLMPVFWNASPKMIGPVRSSRHYFLDYAMEHDAIYIHFGWSPMAENDISKLKINNVNGVGYGGEVFWDITDDPYNWQDSYTSAEKINKFVGKAKYRTETEKERVFTYNETDIELEEGKEAQKVSLRYSPGYTCGFEYCEDTKTYKRFRQGEPHMERVSKKQLEAKNIIIQNVNNYTIKGDEAGRQEVNTVGSGNGWYITCGKAIEIKWSKQGRSTPTKYVDENGKEIVLNPGQTWVQIFPLYGEMVIE